MFLESDLSDLTDGSDSWLMETPVDGFWRSRQVATLLFWWTLMLGYPGAGAIYCVPTAGSVVVRNMPYEIISKGLGRRVRRIII